MGASKKMIIGVNRNLLKAASCLAVFVDNFYYFLGLFHFYFNKGN